MQSFRERSGFHGNQQCYQQEAHELSRLENYRHHQSQTRQGYEAHALAAAKDCYSQQVYPGYSNSTGADKQYKGAKIPTQHLQNSSSLTGYSNHLTNAYSAQYVSEGHLQQKWEDSSHLPQYEQELIGRLESPTSGGQYLEQNLHPISRSQCSHSTQQNPPVYTTHRQQKVQQDTSTSAMTYTQGSLHFPQHSQSLSSSTPSYTVVDKCNQTSHCYKNYAMPSNSQYNRQLGSGTIKQGGYRAQTNYSYQSTPARVGYEQQAPLQAMPNTQDNLSKYQHYNQPQQNYCLTDISVRSPEQYYQNCSPSSSQSPARSVGRSPSYSSTPSPLMVNPETFQYNQPPITTGASSSTGIRDQSLLMPSHTHSSNLNPQPTSYAGSLKDRFSEKLLSNPSLWSLNALTSQVENISNNVQQLLLSEALVSNKKGGKRTPKKTEDYQGQLRALEDGSEAQLATPASEPFSTPQSVHTEMQEGEHSSSSEEQLERIYYMCSQNSPAWTTNNSQVILETVSSDSVTSPDDMSAKSDDSLHSGEPGEHFTTLLRKNLGNEKSPTSQSASSPLKQEENSAAAVIKENFEESAWPDKTRAENEEINELPLTDDEKGDICVVDQGGWLEEEKYPAFFHKLSKVLINKSYPNSMEQKIYQDMQIQYVTDEREDCEKPSSPAEFHCGTAAGSDVDAEMYNSDFPAELNVAGKAVQFNWSNDLVQEQYLTMKEEVSNYSKFNSGVEVFEEKLSAAEENQEMYIEECSVQLSESSKPAVIKDKYSSLLPEETFKHQVWTQESAECSSPEEDQDRGNQIREPKETFLVCPIVQEAAFSSTERSVICDVSPQNPSKTTVLVTPDETTPLSQTSDNSDLEDSMILAHGIPLLATQSVIHSASSWADTPPSSKKWDEEMELGTDCLDEVPESFESESLNAPAKLNELNRKHDEEKTNQPGRLMHTSVRIRRLSSLVGEGLPTAPQAINMSSSKYTTSADQTEATSNNLSSQIPKSLAENPPSRMCTRSFTAQGVPKAFVQIKRQSAPSLPKTASSKDLLCHPTDMLSKIKCLKHKGLKSIEGCIKGKRNLSECCPNGEGQDGTQSILPLLKEQRPMVLRSRKQKQEKPLKEKVKEKRMPNLLPRKLKTPPKQKAVFLKGKARASPKQNTADSHRKVMYRIKNKTEKPAEYLLSALKRKSSGCSPIPVKRHRGVKQGKGEALLDPLNNKEVVAKTPKKKSRRGAHFKTSLNSYLTKESPLVVSSATPCVQAQYPAKTKYLPPRKGRGLKYEAMVQKITSPGSKKNASSTYAENTVANPTTALQSHEENEQIKEAQQLKPRADAESQNVTVELEGNKSPPSKRRKLSVGKICVSRSQIASAFETEVNLVVGPRLAKQRAIKNNHEMHMKQRRRSRKGIGSTVPEDNVVADQHSSTPLLALPPLETELSTPTPVTVETSTCKRVNQRLSHPKKKQVKYLDNKNRQNQKTVKKTGTVRRNRKHLDAVKTKENGCKLKNRHKKQRAPKVEDKEPEIRLKYVSYKPQKNENKPPQFCPYIHIDKSKEMSSICNIVNRPEEACQLLQTRKNNSPRIKNSVAVAKVIPNSSVMQQGPLINKNLIDRCLTCCLCRKPANYRELGDLCGPYYPEDSIPRKTQSFKCKTELGENRVKMLCSSVQSEATEPETEKSSSSVVPGRPRRLDKLPGEHPGVRSKFRDRYRKLHQFQGYNRKAVDAESNPLKEQDCSGPVSQRLELEVDSKEHWVHEACVVWTNGTFLVAGKLYGLQEAVLVASEMNCLKCQESGATVGCCSKGCTQKFHYVCAKDMGCLLREDNFSLKCPKHKGV